MKSVEWRPAESDHELASAGRDNTVMIWDLRSYQTHYFLVPLVLYGDLKLAGVEETQFLRIASEMLTAQFQQPLASQGHAVGL